MKLVWCEACGYYHAPPVNAPECGRKRLVAVGKVKNGQITIDIGQKRNRKQVLLALLQ